MLKERIIISFPMEDSLTSERYWKSQQEIPGSTRVPVDEIKSYLNPEKEISGTVILDLGSGEGRSTSVLETNFPNSKIIAFDLCHEGLEKTTDQITGRVQGTALELPFNDESADAVVLCGVMTNITDKDPQKAVSARQKVISEISRVLAPGGICVISDFNNEHILSNYPIKYPRHQLITGEYGTVAVFEPSANITFQGKSDKEVAQLANSPKLERLAHHYSPKELIDLVKSQENLRVMKYSVEMGRTPSGKAIDTIVMSLRKNQNPTPSSEKN